MKKRSKQLCIGMAMLAVFVLWTVIICLVDVQPIGPDGSSVGLASINHFIHQQLGVHLSLYIITDWLGLVPLITCIVFGMLGLKQWVQRKSLRKVDRSLLMLGGFYIAVMAVYAFFENCVINHRPVLIDGVLEASYPSSTTLLVLCVMPTVIMHFSARLKCNVVKRWMNRLICAFMAFMVIGRLVSGVHWFSDIVGSVFLSAGLVTLYGSISPE